MWKVIYWTLSIYEFMIFIAVLKSFLIYFDRSNRFSRFITKLGFVDALTDPYLNIFRRLIPSAYGLDFSPMIGLFVLQLIEKVVYNNIMIKL